MESSSIGLGALLLILAIALAAAGVFIALASKRSVAGWKILLLTLLPIIAILTVPNLLSIMTDGRAAIYETMPWVALIAIAFPFAWLVWRTRQRRIPAEPSRHGESIAPAPQPESRSTRSNKAAAKPAQGRLHPHRPETHAAAGKAAPPQTAPTVFISYRREDSADVTGRLYDRLTTAFGREYVHKDVDSIPLGVDFREHINALVGTCDVVLAVIGRHWLDVKGAEQTRRLDDERDPVRLEIVAALKREIPVVPVLVSGGKIPPAEALPDEIRNLAYRNGTSVRPDPDFHKDVDRLIAGLRRH